MGRTPDQAKNPRRAAAGKLNRRRRAPLTEAGRERLRAAALENKPWLHSTGPRTPEGKARAVANGKRRQLGGAQSARETRADLRQVRDLIHALRETCRRVAGR